MDLSDIKLVDRKIEILHPRTGSHLGVRVSLMAMDDDRMLKVKRRILDEQQRLMTRGKSFNAEQIEDNRQSVLINAMTGWEWYNPTGKKGDKEFDEEAMPSFHKETPDFNPKNIKAVFNELYWFRDQVQEALGEEKDFFATSETN